MRLSWQRFNFDWLMTKNSRRNPSKRRNLLLSKLEDRILFDATMDAGLDPSASGINAGDANELSSASGPLDTFAQDVANYDQEDSASSNQLFPSQTRNELVIIDTSVDNYQQLVDDLLNNTDDSRNIEVVLLDAESNGLDQVSAILDQYDDLDALHLVTHGEDAGFRLGNTWVTADNLDAFAGQISGWGDALNSSGDILLYGCDLAESAEGRMLVDSIATLTGTDVAASNNDTGSSIRGGDWNLEYRHGTLESTVVFSQQLQANFQGVLAVGPDVQFQDPNQDVRIGEDFQFTVTFDNTGTDTGFGPFVDLVFPVNGADGAAGTDTADGVDFISATYLGQTLNTIELTFPDDGGGIGAIDHPFAVDASGNPLQVTGTAGDKLVVVELPFGSYTTGQPPADIVINATTSNLADLGTDLIIGSRSGFRFGSDPLDNPGADPSIISDAAIDSSSWTEQLLVTPTLLELTKTYLGPEDETATGPNHVQQYRIDIDIADGQTISNLDIIDSLPPNVVVTAINSVEVNGAAAAYSDNLGSLSFPGNNLELIVTPDNDITGTVSTTDVSVVFSFYVTEFDANGDRVIPINGEDDTTSNPDSRSFNNARAVGDWDPIDTRDTGGTDNAVADPDPVGPEHILDDKAIAIQKSVAIVNNVGVSGANPGDTLEYTLNFQISDFYTFGDLVIDDIFQDGQLFDFTYGATFTVTDLNGTVAGNFTVRSITNPDGGQTLVVDETDIDRTDDVGEVGSGASDGSDGTTTLRFDLSQALIDNGAADGILQGGFSNGATNGGAATGTITFRTVIQEEYADTFESGDRSVDQGDTITNNNLSITGTVRENAEDGSISNVIHTETDNSSAQIIIATGTLIKDVYAINGNTTLPTGPSGRTSLTPGDVVTYRIQYTVPTSDFENLRLTDFLPLPIFDVTDHNADGVVDAADDWTFNLAGSFDGSAPASGVVEFGLNDTFYNSNGPASNIIPTISVGASNELQLTYGNYDDPNSESSVIEIYFSITAQDEPTADGLFLTNIVRAQEGTTQNVPTVLDQIIQIEVLQPELNITKGIVSSDSATANFDSPIGPSGISFATAGTGGALFSGGTINSNGLSGQRINANITGGIDAGDTIRYAVVLENTGSSTRGAYDVTVSDSLPAGFSLVAGSVRIVDGTGAAVTYSGSETDLFSTGITLNDPGTTPDTGDGTNAGAIDGFDATDGRNVVIVFYDVTADQSVEANETYVNTATIENFAGLEGGANHAANRPSDDASVRIENVSVVKSILATSEDHTGAIGGVERVTIGEIVRYQIEVALPEGSLTNLQIHDVLPTGLTFIDDGTATVSFVSDGVGITSSAVTSGVLPDSSISRNTGNDNDNFDTGRDVFFKLGDIDNNDRDTNIEYAVIEFNVLVDNNNGTRNDAGESRFNDVRVRTNGSQIYDLPQADRPRVIIAEPLVENIDKAGSITTGDAGDSITYTVTFDVATGNNRSDAFDVRLFDTLPSDLTLSSIASVTIDGVAASFTDNTSGNTIDILLDRVNQGQSVEVVYTATIDLTVSPEDVLANTAQVTWSSLPGDFGTSGNATGSDLASLNGLDTGNLTYDTTTGALHGERDGSNGTANPNDYTVSDTHVLTIDGIGFTKTLVGTEFNDAFNGLTDAVIGELVTYRLEVSFPEGTTPNAIILDTLDNGLAFVGQTNSTLNDVTISGSTTPTVGSNGRTVTWDFGTVIDADLTNDTDGSIVIEYQAVVLNVTGNQEGTNLDNSARFRFNNDPGTDLIRDAADVFVREAHVEVTKSVEVNAPSGSTSGDAGDPVEYTIVIQNTGDYDAFDVTFSDTLPTVTGGTSAILGATFSVVDSLGGVTAADFTLAGNDATGYVLSLNSGVDLDLLKSEGARTITLTVNGTIAPTNGPNDIIVNTANAQWTSLDGDITSRSTFTTDDSGERDGTNPSDNTADYNDGGTASFSINPPVFTKSLFGTDQTETSGTDVTIGERVTYALHVTLPEGTTAGLNVVDLLPPGLNYENFQLVTTTVGSGGLLTADFAGTIAGGDPSVSGGAADGDDVTFTFGQIDVTVDNDTTNNSFLILVTAAVSDVSSNVGYGAGQTTLANTATIDVLGDGVGPVSSNGVDVDVVESNLVITKNIDKSLVDAGEQVSIELRIDNTGLGTAYDVRLEDLLNSAHYDLSSVNIGTSGTDYPADFTASYNAGTGLLAYSGGSIASGGFVTFTLTLDLADSVAPGATLVNTATITNATTLEGNAPGERDNPDPDNDGSDTDNDSVTVRSNSLAGNVYFDADNDGIFDAAESGIAGVDIRLQGTDHLGNTVDITLQTLGDGSYLFDDLRPGTYRITEAQPTTAANGKDYLDGTDTIGTQGGNDSVNDDFSNIVLSTGVETHGTGNNFGELEEAELSGFVWHDADNDGVRDASEVGIGGVDVTLSGTDDQGTITPVTVTTNPDGSYSFDRLRPGEYTITQTQPTFPAPSGRDYADGQDHDGSLANGVSSNDVTSSINATAGDTGINYNFGEVVESIVSGYVYHDSDNDGIRSGETGIEFVTITLTGTDDLGNTINRTTQTDGNGYYEFANLRPAGAGGYTLTQSQPTGYLDGIDTIGTPGGNSSVNDVFSSINVVSDTNGTENNFGELLAASISGTVFNDHNNDGLQQAGEQGIGGVQIRLTGTDDLGNSVDVAVSTNADGTYSITGLRPSDATGYTLTETQPTNYNDGIDSDGSLVNGDVSTNDVNSGINIVSDDDGTGYNFAERGASISGTVYIDENSDGNLTGTETRRVDGVTIELYDSTGTSLLATTTTAPDGTYSFDNLPADDYVIRQIQPTSLSSTTPNQINATLPLAGLTDQDFGEEFWRLGGNVYFDADNDGVFDATETGIGNVDVRLQGVDHLGGIVDTTVQTLADGSYLFVDLLPGTYSITETQPLVAANGKDYLDGQDTIGTPGGDDSANDEFSNIVLGAGVTTNGIHNNFGELEEAELSGFVWHDANNDGVRDASEVGIGGVDVTLSGVDDLGSITPVTVTTNPDGSYSFDRLRPGEYTITQTQPTFPAPSGRDYADGQDHDGSLANGVSSNDVTSSINAAAGDTGINYNFGEVVESIVSGYVYHDSDNDGIRSGETGIEFVTITLTGTDDLGNTINRTTQTDGNGYYEFANLRPAGAGGYTLTQSQPTGYLDGIDTIGTPGGNSSVNDVFSSINVVSDTNGTENNFGELLAASVSGTVFNDHNNDGVQQAGEQGIGGVQIRLTGTDDLGNSVDVAVSTNADGTYSITGLRPSDTTGYTLTETQPTNYNDGIDSDGSLANGDVSTNDVNSGINVVSDDDGTGYDFAERGTTISGTVYVDDNRNSGLDATETNRVSGVLIELYDSTGTTLIDSMLTNGSGDYQFTDLPADDYIIREIHPAQYSSTTPDTRSATLTLAGLTDQNFGENLWDLGDFVWFDTNGDGVQDAGEPGLAGIGVTLTYAGLDGDFSTTADNIVYNTTTDASGAYSFEDLFNGDYRVTIASVDLPGGVIRTAEVDDSAAAIDGVSNVAINGGDRFDVDFGYTGTGSVGDTVFWDQNANAVQDANEIGLEGVVVELDVDLNGDGNVDLTLSTTTDGNGEYLFERVPAGNHVVRVTQPSGTVQTFDSDGVGSGNQSTVALTPGEDNADQDFGYRGTGSIGNTVFFDFGGDGGAFGASGDYGLAGVTVTLQIDVDGDGSVDLTRTQTTDANGEYLFENLIAGDYKVSLDPTDLSAALGDHPTVDRDSTLDHETDVTLADGQDVVDADFGYFATPEYEIIKSDDLAGAPATPGTTFSYFLFVTNHGDQDGTGVVVTDDLPIHVLDAFSVVTDDPANVSYDSTTGRLIWNAGDLAGLGGNRTLRVTVTVQDPVNVLLTSFDNTATVTDDGTHGPDPILPNNSSTVSASLTAVPDYEIEKTSSLTDTAMVGDSFFYTIRVSNIGDQDGTGVVVTDQLPVSVIDRFNVTTDDPANVSYDSSTGELIWNVGDLDGRGDTRTLTVFVEIPFVVEDPLANVIINTATVTDDGTNGPEERLDNNTSTVEDDVLVFAFDTFNNFSMTFSPERDLAYGREYGVSARNIRPLPVDPIFSGLAEPGTTLSLKIYDDAGNVIGERQVVADSSGNWLANFPNTVIWKHPHRMDVEQTAPIQTDVQELDGFNMRRYFHPATHHSLFFTERDTVSSVTRNSAYETIDSMHEANNNPLQVGWRSHLYQLNVSSTNAAAD